MLDPLGEAADPSRYVPIVSSERALTALAAGLDAGRTPLLVAGPSGLGKTLLLRMLADAARRCGQRVVLSPFLHLPPEDVARWLLYLMGDAEGGACDQSHLLSALRGDRRRTLVLVDEAHAAPEASVRWLGELARAARPQVAVVAAASTGPALASRAEALDPELTVTLAERLPIAEMHALCDAILALSPSLRRALDVRGEEAVLRAAAGNPALLKNELSRRLELAARSELVAMVPRLEASPKEPLRAELAHELRGGFAHGLRGELAHGEPARIEARAAAHSRPEPSFAEPPAPQPARVETACAELPIAVGLPLAASRPAPGGSQEAPRVEARHGTSRGHGIFRRHAVGTRATAAQEPPGRGIEPRYVPRPGPRLERPRSQEEARSQAPRDASAQQQAPRLEPPREGSPRSASFRRPALVARVAAAWRAPRRTVSREPSDERPRRIESRRSDRPRAHAPRRDAPLREAPKPHAAATAAGPARPRPALGIAKAAVALLAVGLAFGTAGRRPLSGEAATLPMPPALRAGIQTEPDALLAAPPRPFVGVQVNAHPWARIRVDGRDIGATPLRVPLRAGTYDFEAALPDGQTLRRRIDVGPAQRFVAFQ